MTKFQNKKRWNLRLPWRRHRFWMVIVVALSLLLQHHGVAAVPDDQHDGCGDWAARGECDNNPSFMLVSCAHSCHEVQQAEAAADQQLHAIQSFYDLSAPDLQGNLLEFEQFRGKIVVLTNVASYCGYTASHYQGLVELWSHVAGTGEVEILAFPCNQFGQQEPGTAADIAKFAAERGVHFRMMQKIDVNGPHTSLVYRYLKRASGKGAITWNFATYFVFNPHDETVTSMDNIETPMDLHPMIMTMAGREEEL